MCTSRGVAALRTPAGGVYYQTEFTWQSKFVHDNPQYQSIDRRQKRYHHGVLEWIYPEARRYWLDDVKQILDRYAVDGIYMDTRTELMSPEHADQFGFNEPIVREFKQRYGVNILEEDFDVELWRSLRGEYFTLFLEEMARLIHSKGKLFSLGTSRGDYIGFPLGNMKLHWRDWIAKKTIDELHLDEHGWGWGPQGYGYLTDFATSRGLKPLDAALREDYAGAPSHAPSPTSAATGAPRLMPWLRRATGASASRPCPRSTAFSSASVPCRSPRRVVKG